jgi:hypothetical protein
MPSKKFGECLELIEVLPLKRGTHPGKSLSGLQYEPPALYKFDFVFRHPPQNLGGVTISRDSTGYFA